MAPKFTFYTGELGFYVRSVGDLDFAPGVDAPRKEAGFGEIFWCIAGSGHFRDAEGTEHTLSPDQVWYYPPGSVHIYGAGSERFRFRWLTIDGPMAAMLFEGLKIVPGINPAGRCPEEHFDRICTLADNPSRMPEMLAEALNIFLKIISPGNRKTAHENLAGKAKKIIDSEFRNQNLNIESIADQLNCHRVSVARDFKMHYGMPISHYLHSLRTQEAFSLIHATGKPLNEIPPLCGFSSISYLTKVIKK
jgi:AraC-like DNA-binding protein